MNESAWKLARQTSWAITGAQVVTGERLIASAAEASALARWLGLHPDAAVPGPGPRTAAAAHADAARDASTRACPAA